MRTAQKALVAHSPNHIDGNSSQAAVKRMTGAFDTERGARSVMARSSSIVEIIGIRLYRYYSRIDRAV